MVKVPCRQMVEVVPEPLCGKFWFYTMMCTQSRVLPLSRVGIVVPFCECVRHILYVRKTKSGGTTFCCVLMRSFCELLCGAFFDSLGKSNFYEV